MKEILYTKEKYAERKRLFSDKFVVLDEDNNPLEDNQTALRKFLKFYRIGPKEFFGGRVLIAESSVTTDGKEKSSTSG